MYHQRIKYPDQEEEGGKAADGPPSGTPSGPGDGR
jgi:hypothetical protein